MLVVQHQVFASLKKYISTKSLTGYSGWDGSPQSSHRCHADLLRGELLGAGVSSGDHVGLQQCSLQVHMVV